MSEVYDHTDEQEIRNLLVGRKVVKADTSTGIIKLDNGLVLRFEPNPGEEPYGEGEYFIDHLAEVDNVIMDVSFELDHLDDDGRFAYHLFVYAENKKINLASVSGDDGSGWYGTGYRIHVLGVEQ